MAVVRACLKKGLAAIRLCHQSRRHMVLPGRFELPTSPLPRECSTPELRQRMMMGLSLSELKLIDKQGMSVKALTSRFAPYHFTSLETMALVRALNNEGVKN